MGIIQKLTYSVKRLNDINAELEANRENLKKRSLVENERRKRAYDNLHKVRGSTAFRVKGVLDADISEVHKRLDNIDIAYLRSRG